MDNKTGKIYLQQKLMARKGSDQQVWAVLGRSTRRRKNLSTWNYLLTDRTKKLASKPIEVLRSIKLQISIKHLTFKQHKAGIIFGGRPVGIFLCTYAASRRFSEFSPRGACHKPMTMVLVCSSLSM